MDILVNRFTVKYNGKDYGPGKIVRGVPDEQGRKLVDESNGEMQELPAAEPAVEPEKEPAADPAADTAADTETDPAADNATEQPGGGLDPIDPEKTVKGKK